MSTTNKSKSPVITTGSKPATRSGTPTNGDLMQAIAGIQATQSSQFRELQVSLVSVTKQLADLKNDNLLLLAMKSPHLQLVLLYLKLTI